MLPVRRGHTEVTGDLNGPSVEWWGTVSGTDIGENERKTMEMSSMDYS